LRWEQTKVHNLLDSLQPVANFVLVQSEINIAIGDRPPEICFQELPMNRDV
jgi:hypothetical protein